MYVIACLAAAASLLGRAGEVTGLNNGLAKTPPMGWLSWERFECNTDCVSNPDTCIGERLLKRTADVMAADGYREAGYQYVVVDDCWLADTRDKDGRLQPDPVRFPGGMKNLSDYIHGLGLKLGVYEDVGRHTCGGCPGTIGNYELDAHTFADWGVDMLKFDGCNANLDELNYGYPAMSHYLNSTGRQILYSCEWAIYVGPAGGKPYYPAVAAACNTFRAYGDIWDAFQSITTIVDYYGDDSLNISAVAGPGNFNDADMLVIGNYGLSQNEERVQMGMWAMIASPLLMSVDLATINPVSRALLLNPRVIAISQDPLGIQGKRRLNLLDGKLQLWTRPVMPRGSYAIAVVNFKPGGYPLKLSVRLADVGLTSPGGYNITEVFDGIPVGLFKPRQNLTIHVNPSGIEMLSAVAL